ncbi:cation-transporting P-type ATPase [Sulfuricurvum sp. MLSB]|uniref:cation-translocating P-type ATPase n=2 Tax=unclassified Sulfuricurvum TaxID=2632390 RepID=UPI000B18A275|nr:cation-transporting P-type ATPase [Sulfuricurvum sp. MLSB]
MELPKSPWSQSPQVLFDQLRTSSEGLNAVDAEERLEHFGPNTLKEEQRSGISLFIGQFASPIVIILVVAAVISFAMDHTKDGIIILAILIINALLGFYQELKAETSIRALQRLTESHVRVLRNGIEALIPSRELVPGDIVILAEGDIVPADIRLIDSHALQADEAVLTGESLPCDKNSHIVPDHAAPIFERRNILFSGTSILRGKTTSIVVATGESTEIARIARSAQEDSPQSPLTRSIQHFSKLLLIAIILILSFLAFIALMQGRGIDEVATFMLAQLVSAVPEGLPIVITLILAIGAYRLSRHKILVRHLPSVESLGSATLIATDKTGTVTEGVLSVKEEIALDSSALRICAALCNDAKNGHGDGVDVALAKWLGDDFEATNLRYERVFYHPFDPVTRMMATVNRFDGSEKLYVKGAYEALLPLSVNPDDELLYLKTAHNEMASQGLRVLAFGVSDRHWEDPSSAPIVLTGLVAFADRPKAGAAEAIALAKKAGIRFIMITGDNPITAHVIAREVGMAEADLHILTGADIDRMDDIALQKALKNTSVIARAMPEHKYRIVQTLQHDGEIVAVTGDGVNDVPALKAADLGIAMGNGSEAAKSSAKMVLVDNNLGVIVDAIRQGRVIADNLRKVLFYLLSTSLGEIMIISVAILMALPLPLHPTQILWINIVTDGVNDKMFSMCKEEGNVMTRGVRGLKQQFFDRATLLRLVWFAFATALMSISLFLYLLSTDHPYETALTATFCTVVVAQWINAVFAQKESEPLLKNIRRTLTINPWIWMGITTGVALQGIALYIIPEWFHVIPPSAEILGYVFIASTGIFILEEGYKWGEYWLKRRSTSTHSSISTAAGS